MNLLEKIAALENEAAEFVFQWETTDQIKDQIQGECIEVDEHLTALCFIKYSIRMEPAKSCLLNARHLVRLN